MEDLSYTFEEWKDGKFIINTGDEESKIKSDLPEIEWHELSLEDVKLISAEQSKIHKSMVKEVFDESVKIFNERIENAKFKNIPINAEITEIEKLINYNNPNNKKVTDVYLDYFDVNLSNIQQINMLITKLSRGIVISTESVSYHNRIPHIEYKYINTVKAESIWLYYEWLLSQRIINVQEDLIELPSDNSKFSNPEKLILLNQLGVIDFLREQVPFNENNSSLARVIAKLIDGKESTIKSNLNAMKLDSSHSNSVNNPMDTIKNVKRIDVFLDREGFKKKN